MNCSQTVAGDARNETDFSLALGTAYVVVQFERFANGYSRQRKLPDGRVLDHVNTLNFLNG